MARLLRQCTVAEKAAKNPMSRRRLLRSAGAAALRLTVPKFVHAQSLEPRHAHWDELLSHIGMSRQSGSNWLRSWLGGLMHEPEARLRGIVLHGAAGSGKSSFIRSFGGLLVHDGFVVTNERSLLEYGYLDAWRIVAMGPRLRQWREWNHWRVTTTRTLSSPRSKRSSRPCTRPGNSA